MHNEENIIKSMKINDLKNLVLEVRKWNPLKKKINKYK